MSPTPSTDTTESPPTLVVFSDGSIESGSEVPLPLLKPPNEDLVVDPSTVNPPCSDPKGLSSGVDKW